MASPKHKIFFGAPPVKIPGIASKPSVAPWTWDASFAIFSSEAKTFDADYDVETLVTQATS